MRTEQHRIEAIDDESSNAREDPDAVTEAMSEGQASSFEHVHAFRMNLVREPGAGNPHARFDERGAETEWMARLSETPTRKGGNGQGSHGLEPSPLLDSTDFPGRRPLPQPISSQWVRISVTRVL